MGEKEIIDPFIPSNMNFQTILMPKVNLAKFLSEKSWSLRTILNLSMLRHKDFGNQKHISSRTLAHLDKEKTIQIALNLTNDTAAFP